MSYPGHTLVGGGLSPFAEMQSVYSIAQVDYADMISAFPTKYNLFINNNMVSSH